MSNVVSLTQRRAPTVAVAKGRLDGIWTAVETFVSHVQLDRLTLTEMARVLRIFDTANACIQIVLSDFNSDPAINQLIDRSREIKAQIDTARAQIVCLETMQITAIYA